VVLQWVTTKLQSGQPIDVAFMAREITHALMVLEQDEKHQGPLLAHIVGSLSGEYLKRRGLIRTEDATTSGGNGSSFG
jgi:hypothetical protein